MITIRVDNNKSRLFGDTKVIHKLRETIKIRVKNSWFAMKNNKWGWDGYVRWITENTHMFPTGLLPLVVHFLKQWDEDYELEDVRDSFKQAHEITELGGKELRDYQLAAVKTLLENKFEGIRFQRGILHEATNAGKNLIAAAIFKSFHNKRQGVFLIDEKEIFDQAVEELSELMPGEVGYINAKHIKPGRVTVCMIPTLGRRLTRDRKLQGWLAKQDIVIYDEADKSANGTGGKRILGYAFNANIRVALTGTAGMSKDKIKNRNIEAYFGPVVHRTTNKELVDKGYSTPPDIRIYTGNKTYRFDRDWKHEHEFGIIRNTQRHKKVWKLIKKFNKHLPAMIMFRHHKHGREILKACPPSIREAYKIKMVHGETPNRRGIIKKFKEGKVDILICSMILKRGKNIPRTKMMINAAGGDTMEDVIQILGRLLRTHETKKKVLFIDLYDWGAYLQRHSKHRMKALKKEGFEVALKYQNTIRTIEREWRNNK
jgi:superfamily II DNA or RNA helicase